MEEKNVQKIRLDVVKAVCTLEASEQCWIIELLIGTREQKIRGYALEGCGLVELLFELEPTSPPPAFLSGELIVVPDKNNALLRLADNLNIHPRFIERIIRIELQRCWFSFSSPIDPEFVYAAAMKKNGLVQPLSYPVTPLLPEISDLINEWLLPSA